MTWIILASVGITALSTQSDLLNPIRSFVQRISSRLAYFTTCMQCQGIWVGAVLGYAGYRFDAITSFEAWLVAPCASLAGWILQIAAYRLSLDSPGRDDPTP